MLISRIKNYLTPILIYSYIVAGKERIVQHYSSKEALISTKKIVGKKGVDNSLHKKRKLTTHSVHHRKDFLANMPSVQHLHSLGDKKDDVQSKIGALPISCKATAPLVKNVSTTEPEQQENTKKVGNLAQHIASISHSSKMGATLLSTQLPPKVKPRKNSKEYARATTTTTASTTKTRDELRRDHFSQQSTSIADKFAQLQDRYKQQHKYGGELIKDARGRPSSACTFTSEATFDQTYLHLVLSGYLEDEDLRNLNPCNFLYEHLCSTIKRIKLDHIYDLFKYD